MKVICAGCSTKYSIEDDKLAGKVFKIRCRTCGQSVVVRGEASAASAADTAPAAPAAAPAAPAWHAVQDGRQIGPFDSGELLRRRAAGEIDDDSYVWRDGFAEWQPLGTVDELRPAAAAAPGAPVVAPGAPGAPAVAPRAVAAAADASRLHGERGESSLLFTLNGLAKQAAPAAAPARAGGAAGEGSGLIDIRSLARAYEPVARATGAARPASASTGIGSPADLPMFPSGAFVSPSVLIPPVVVRRDRRLVAGLAAAAGLLAICATLLVVIALTRNGQPAAPEALRPAPEQRVAKIDPPAARRGASPNVVEPPAAPAAPAAPPAVQVRTPAPPATQARPPAPPATQARPPATPARTPAQVRTPAPPAPPAPPAGPKCDQVTCIVNGYDSDCCRALRGGASPTGPTGSEPVRSSLPENLDRAAITEGLATISTKRCSGGSSATGLVKAQLKVSAAGAVTAVNVQSSPDAALSACVVEQAQRGRFKPTQRGGSFGYVWRF